MAISSTQDDVSVQSLGGLVKVGFAFSSANITNDVFFRITGGGDDGIF